MKYVILALLLMSCGRPITATYVSGLDASYTPWLDYTTYELDGLMGEPLLHKDGLSITIELDDLKSQHLAGLAMVGDTRCSVYIEKTMFRPDNEDQIKGVLLHELGHCFGLHHVDDRKDIMYYMDYPIDWTYAYPKYVDALKKIREM